MYNEFGFFRDLYLFRSGVHLTNSEIDEVSRRVLLAAQLAKARADGRNMVEYSHPEPLRLYFPTTLMSCESDALSNLREVALVGRRDRPVRTVDLGPTRRGGPDETAVLARRPVRHVTSE